MMQHTTDIKVADDNKHAEDIVEDMDILTAENPATVARKGATDMQDGIMKYLPCGRTSKKRSENDETYGFQNETEPEEKIRKLSRNPSFGKAMGSQVNAGKTTITHEAATSHTTATEYPGKATGKQEQFSSAVNPNAYDFTHPQRGYMVLIVNEKFLKEAKRDGAKCDMLKSEEIGRKLGFRILNRNNEKNLKKAEMIRVLQEAQAMDYSDSDCFSLIISTHGLEEQNPRANWKLDHALMCSDDQVIFTSDIINMFSDRICPTLKNKPRLFFIQACRGENVDRGHEVSVAHHRKVEDRTCGVTGPDPAGESVDEQDTLPWDHNSNSIPGGGHSIRSQFVPKDPLLPIRPRKDRPLSSGIVGSHNIHNTTVQHAPSATVRKIYAPRPYPMVDTPSLKCDNDFLVMYAIPPGMFAWRNEKHGSWLIDDLHKVITENNMAESNLLSLLTKVSAKMSQRKTNTPATLSMHQKKAVPVIEHKLTKDVIFTPKAAMSHWVR